ncbi:MAG: thiamine biosynthesis protein ThiS [Anaerolineae bacterium]|nr:thiamine biosynthesis protein ThiS [Anaerolineae bacterium]
MAVTLIPTGMLKEYTGGQDRLELVAGPTVTEMLEAAGIPPAVVAGVVRDGELVPKDYRPRDGETIKVLVIMGGG